MTLNGVMTADLRYLCVCWDLLFAEFTITINTRSCIDCNSAQKCYNSK